MLKICLYLPLFLFIINDTFAQKMTYLGHGKVSLNEQIIKRPRQLKKILESQNSQALTETYKKYIWRKRSAQFFSTISGLGLVSSVEDGVFGTRPKINWTSVSIAVGGAITAELFHRPSKSSLKRNR